MVCESSYQKLEIWHDKIAVQACLKMTLLICIKYHYMYSVILPVDHILDESFHYETTVLILITAEAPIRVHLALFPLFMTSVVCSLFCLCTLGAYIANNMDQNRLLLREQSDQGS